MQIDKDWTQFDFAIVDVEGNGESPQEIIEVAIVHIRLGEITSQLDQWLVRPVRPVTERAVRLHGISNEMLAGKPRFADIASQVSAALGSDIVVGHNAQVDVELLKKAIPNWQPVLVLDTLRLARATLSGARSYSLASLVAERQLAAHAKPLHRALGDALAAAHLFLDLISKLEAPGHATLRKLIDVAGVVTTDFVNNQQQDLF